MTEIATFAFAAQLAVSLVFFAAALVLWWKRRKREESFPPDEPDVALGDGSTWPLNPRETHTSIPHSEWRRAIEGARGLRPQDVPAHFQDLSSVSHDPSLPFKRSEPPPPDQPGESRTREEDRQRFHEWLFRGKRE